MTDIVEGNLSFHFPDGWQAGKLDDWQSYRQHYIKMGSSIKCMDFWAIDSDRSLWLIEVKDYRIDRKIDFDELIDVLVDKVKDSLGLLTYTACQDAGKDEQKKCEKKIARQLVHSQTIKIAYHIEQPKHPNKLKAPSMALSNLKLKIKKRLKSITTKIIVTDIDNNHSPWRVN